MFDISFGELFIVFVVALLVLGPERLPKVAHTLGRLIGRLQRQVSDIRHELAREGELAELRKAHEEATRSLQDLSQQVLAPLHEAERSLQDGVQAVETVVHEPVVTEPLSIASPAVEATPPAETLATPDLFSPPEVATLSLEPAAETLLVREVDERQLDLFDEPPRKEPV
ncbi:Sec-independent protein translocase protein TatB [Leeia aquatica]|uniref:Sec-independent protein translocase protein TatB n=1 Tax=Leeia aquatica TaxID=2725557 RepID=A0A847SHS9_9NEIS|nr:Sec-independent protein translocase protein TatB [Leeia aquatica]NLR76878.1 twin-arginine translocase subunit TatB [Leeia aquatica]